VREKKPEEQLAPKQHKDLTQNPYYKKGLQKEEISNASEQKQVRLPRKEQVSQSQKSYTPHIPQKEGEEAVFYTKATSLKDALLSAMAKKNTHLADKEIKIEEVKAREVIPEVSSDIHKEIPKQSRKIPTPSHKTFHKKPLHKSLKNEFSVDDHLQNQTQKIAPKEERQPLKKEERAATEDSKRSLREMLEKLNLSKKEQGSTATIQKQSDTTSRQEVDPSVVQKLFE
jgi:hypothetical protein